MCWAESSDMARPERLRGHQNACQADLQAQLGASKLHSKRNLEALGRHLGLSCPSKPHSKRNLAPLGLNLALQAALQVQLGAYWVDFWCSCNPQNQALASTRAQFSWFSHFCGPRALGLLFRNSSACLSASRAQLRLSCATELLFGAFWTSLRANLALQAALQAQLGTKTCQQRCASNVGLPQGCGARAKRTRYMLIFISSTIY